jgi:hypothetical protein
MESTRALGRVWHHAGIKSLPRRLRIKVLSEIIAQDSSVGYILVLLRDEIQMWAHND